MGAVGPDRYLGHHHLGGGVLAVDRLRQPVLPARVGAGGDVDRGAGIGAGQTADHLVVTLFARHRRQLRVQDAVLVPALAHLQRLPEVGMDRHLHRIAAVVVVVHAVETEQRQQHVQAARSDVAVHGVGDGVVHAVAVQVLVAERVQDLLELREGVRGLAPVSLPLGGAGTGVDQVRRGHVDLFQPIQAEHGMVGDAAGVVVAPHQPHVLVLRARHQPVHPRGRSHGVEPGGHRRHVLLDHLLGNGAEHALHVVVARGDVHVAGIGLFAGCEQQLVLLPVAPPELLVDDVDVELLLDVRLQPVAVLDLPSERAEPGNLHRLLHRRAFHVRAGRGLQSHEHEQRRAQSEYSGCCHLLPPVSALCRVADRMNPPATGVKEASRTPRTPADARTRRTAATGDHRSPRALTPGDTLHPVRRRPCWR